MRTPGAAPSLPQGPDLGAGTAADAVIVARGLIQIYPADTLNIPALRGLDLEVVRGELVGIIGPSGSGKSTLLRVLAGLERPSAGTLSAFGVRLERAPDSELARYRNETVGVVEQHYWRAISPYLTAAAIIELPLALRGWPAEAGRVRARELLGRIGLGERAAARPGELSGGEQQRLAFAAALAHRPSIVLADEPTGELDERTAAELLDLLSELARSEGSTVIVVTHDPIVEAVADRILHLHDGRVIATRVGGPGGILSGAVDPSGWRAPGVAKQPSPVGPLAAPEPGLAAIELVDVSRIYGSGPSAVRAIDGLSATFRQGGLHVVTGPSGSGKSTLLRLIVGLDRPSRGTVRTLDADLARLDRAGLARLRTERIAVMSQAPRLVPFLSVAENVELGLAIRSSHLSARDRHDRALSTLDAVGLADLSDAWPDRLSGGERARVALARSLATDPDLLVLDEPTAALDRWSAGAVIRLLQALDPAMTVLVATHDRDLIAAATHRLDLRDVRRRGALPDDR
jgi:ABC-type lipoprotein export system ATPase subunit